MKKIEDDNSLMWFYVRKGMYYKPNSCGYTDFQNKAGIYQKDEALSHARGCDDITIVPVNIEEHNKSISNEIKSLQSRLIEN